VRLPALDVEPRRELARRHVRLGQNWTGLLDSSAVNIHLTRELQALIKRKLATGRYGSASEVVREGLRLLADEDELKAEARRKVAEGLADLKAGRVLDGEEAVADILKHLRKRRSRPKAG